jgi:glucose-6-phosphate isomerase
MSRHSDIHFDFNFMMADHLGDEIGLMASQFDQLEPALCKVHEGVMDLHKLGQLPVLDLPYHEEEARQLIAAGQKIQEQYEDVVVLGIGGSALGVACLEQALKPLYYKHQVAAGPRLWIVDNIDPAKWQGLRDVINLKKTYFIVISKSGGTTETIAAYLYFLSVLKKEVGNDCHDRVAFITDPDKGALAKLAKEEGIISYPIHPGVGGRFSVLTPVGLFPAACLGIDIESLLAGSRRMLERCQKEDMWLNPALLTAALHYLYYQDKKRSMRVVMAYSDHLSHYPDWFAQLWAESLGKRHSLSGEEICIGSTPIKAMGTVDQHSLMQLFLDGPQDKVVNFIGLKNHEQDLKVPASYVLSEEWTLPAGNRAGDILNMEREATERALLHKGRPSMTILLEDVSSHSLGQLILWAELETIVTGELYNINPFDQPGIEAIKNYIKGALGKKGFEKYKAELEGNDKKKQYIL